MRAVRLLVVGLALSFPLAAHAQLIPPGKPGLSLERLIVPSSSNRIFAVPTARTLDLLNFSVALAFDYANSPLVVPGGSAVVGNQLSAQLIAALGLGRVEIGVGLPATLYQTTDYASEQPNFAKAALGDLRVEAKLRATPERSIFALAIDAMASFPTGSGDNYTGEQGFAFAGRVIGDLTTGRVTLAAYIGYRYRTRPITFVDLYLADEVLAGAAAAFSVVPRHLDLFGEAWGAFGVRGNPNVPNSSAGAVEMPAEALLGLKLSLDSGLSAAVGAGPGISDGYGSPTFRVVAGIGYARVLHDTDHDGIDNSTDLCPTEPEDKDNFEDSDGCPDPDNDRDGVPDATDKCPNVPEDRDGFEDGDGCPDPDNDKDGIPDATDKCPNQPEDRDGFEDNDGCPDQDNDQDGVPDGQDKCPAEAEDRDGFEDNDGCPDRDNDKDGIPDAKDKCPNQPEDFDGFQDDDGCPDPDNDQDGIPDATDKCPNEPETFNGFEDEDGCPDKGKELVKLKQTQVEIEEKIFFDTNSARIKPRSFKLLDTVARVINLHGALKRIEIAGHTDERGTAAHNRELSEARAQAVMKYLVEQGKVAAARLSAKGYGADQPVVEKARSAADHDKNRRVEFSILERE
jgi:outer membrane protein OmpA-like peptidoglycan-associated protein